jgi:hypothetical protein
MTDVVTRLRQTRADMLGTEDEQHYWDCHDAASEIERLRLTRDERAAIASVLNRLCCEMTDDERRLLLRVCSTQHGDPGGQAPER